MNRYPFPPVINEAVSPGKVTSLKARWLKNFNETGMDLSMAATSSASVTNDQIQEDGVDVSNRKLMSVVERTEVPSNLVMRQPMYGSTGETGVAGISPPTLAIGNAMMSPPLMVPQRCPMPVEQNRNNPVAADVLQYRLAQARAQMNNEGGIASAFPNMSLEQSSQFIKDATMFYLAQAELAREANKAAVSLAKVAKLDMLPSTNGGMVGHYAPTNTPVNHFERSKTSPAQQYKFKGDVPSPPDRQLYPTINTTKTPAQAATTTTSLVDSTVNITEISKISPTAAIHQENGIKQDGNISTSCNCVNKHPEVASPSSKVSKDMAIQTDDLSGLLLVDGPNKQEGGSTINQALQLLQTSQPYELCKNWLAKHVMIPNLDNNLTNTAGALIAEPPSNSKGASRNNPLELLQAAVTNSGMNVMEPNQGSSNKSPAEKGLLGSFTRAVNAGTGTEDDALCVAESEIDYTTHRPVNNKCPVCSDVISGYHYGIYSCESCKGFFKRTVQSGRNRRLRCGRDDMCRIDLDTRKHCAACRFNKCLKLGMKLEAIRGDRQRGGRSMYQGSSEQRRREELHAKKGTKPPKRRRRTTLVKKVIPPAPVTTPTANLPFIKQEPTDLGSSDCVAVAGGDNVEHTTQGIAPPPLPQPMIVADVVPAPVEVDPMLKEMVEAENLLIKQERLMDCCRESCDQKDGNIFTTACHIMDHQLYNFVKWARTLPLYRDLKTEDQIVLMQRRGLHLMTITLCFYFIDEDNRISLPNGQKVQKGCTDDEDVEDIIERLLDTAGRFRTAKLDKYQLVCLKTIMLLNPVSRGLIEPDRVQELQEKMEDLLIDYVTSQPHIDDRVTGELLLRLSEVERICQLVREQVIKCQAEDRLGRFPLLMELFQDKPSWLY